MSTPERKSPSRPIEDWERELWLEDPREKMSVLEAEICERLNYCGNEIETLEATIRLLVSQMLMRWGLFADQRSISVNIRVSDCEEAITWIEQPRKIVNFHNIHENICGLNAQAHVANATPYKISFRRASGEEITFNLTLAQESLETT